MHHLLYLYRFNEIFLHSQPHSFFFFALYARKKLDMLTQNAILMLKCLSVVTYLMGQKNNHRYPAPHTASYMAWRSSNSNYGFHLAGPRGLFLKAAKNRID